MQKKKKMKTKNRVPAPLLAFLSYTKLELFNIWRAVLSIFTSYNKVLRRKGDADGRRGGVEHAKVDKVSDADPASPLSSSEKAMLRKPVPPPALSDSSAFKRLNPAMAVSRFGGLRRVGD